VTCAPSDELRALFAAVFAEYQHDEASAGRKSSALP
jgi:hypothetical protein